MTRDEIRQRVLRVQQVVEGHGGKVTFTRRALVVFEVPPDISVNLTRIWGEGGFAPTFVGQTWGRARKRALRFGSAVLLDEECEQALYKFECDVRQDPRHPAAMAEAPAKITATPVPPSAD